MSRLTRRAENGTAVYATPSGEPVKWENNRREVLQKLADYEDLEEQGLLFKSPYKIGDIFYLCTYRIIIRLKISCIEFRHDNTAFYRTYVADTGELGIPFGINDIGKTAFLTREEAEKELKRMESAE